MRSRVEFNERVVSMVNLLQLMVAGTASWRINEFFVNADDSE
jgi:hypothetical protein